MRNKKTFFYIVGSISLAFILIFGIFFLLKNKPFETYGVKSVVFYNRDYEKLQEFTLEEFLETKIFINLELTGNTNNDKKVLDIFRMKVRELVVSKDSIKGVHLKLNPKTKYEEFIKAIDICETEKAVVYIPYENNLWVTNRSTKKFQKLHPLKKPTNE